MHQQQDICPQDPVTFLPGLVLVIGKTNIKDDELDAMLKEASGPINFTMFLNMFGAKLTGESYGSRLLPGQGQPSGQSAKALCVLLATNTQKFRYFI